MIAAGPRRAAVGAAWLAAALGVASAAVSAYWLAGGTALLETVGGEVEEWGRRRSAAVVVALVVIVGLKLAAALAPLALVGVGADRLPAWTRGRATRALGWLAAVVLTLYGGLFTGVGLLVEAGVIDAAADVDERAMAWHAYFWDPWFALWGVASMVALWASRPNRFGAAGAGGSD